jgi:hypothetical protein
VARVVVVQLKEIISPQRIWMVLRLGLASGDIVTLLVSHCTSPPLLFAFDKNLFANRLRSDKPANVFFKITRCRRQHLAVASHKRRRNGSSIDIREEGNSVFSLSFPRVTHSCSRFKFLLHGQSLLVYPAAFWPQECPSPPRLVASLFSLLKHCPPSTSKAMGPPIY